MIQIYSNLGKKLLISNIFIIVSFSIDNNSVGKLEITEDVLSSTSGDVMVQEALRDAYSEGINLVYVLSPIELCSETPSTPKFKLPGVVVDDKTTYQLFANTLDEVTLRKNAYSNENIRIRIEPKSTDNNSTTLKELAVAAGEWSRFRVDTNIPSNIYESIFEAWLKNSINRSIADEIFVAKDVKTNEDIGFITVKRHNNNIINIGLLSVNSKFRRQNIAKSLLSRAVLYALESNDYNSNTIITVITQGLNKIACLCYEHFGFTKYSIQTVLHAWLPQHIIEPLQRSDKAKLQFCKQYFTGNESKYIHQVLNSGLDSAARFTTMCASKLQEIFGPESERVIMTPSGTAALEMAALLINLKENDEVIMPSYTFSSTANAVVLRGAKPVFIDIKIDTLNINEKLIEAAITERTKAIFVVHYAGCPCEMDEICEIAKRYNLFVIEDAAQG